MCAWPSSGCSAPKNRSARLKERTTAALALVGLTAASSKRPNEISGGMKQRVGIARALSMEPKVLLMDEPFGALDALTRAHLQDELMRIVAKTGSTVVMVTHDVDEAVLLSDRIVMMTNGPRRPSATSCRCAWRVRATGSSLHTTRSTLSTARGSWSSCTTARRARPRKRRDLQWAQVPWT